MVFGTLIDSSDEIEKIGMKVVKVHRASVDLMDWVRLIIRSILGFGVLERCFFNLEDIPENRSYICSSTSSRSLIVSLAHVFLDRM
jgi:hypothetical protein